MQYLLLTFRQSMHSLPQKIGKTQNQSLHTHCISENFQSDARTKG